MVGKWTLKNEISEIRRIRRAKVVPSILNRSLFTQVPQHPDSAALAAVRDVGQIHPHRYPSLPFGFAWRYTASAMLHVSSAVALI